MPAEFVVALTGASGSVYGRRLVEVLVRSGATVQLTVSEAAAKVYQHETGIPLDLEQEESVLRGLVGPGSFPNLRYAHVRDLEQPIASGSHRHDGMAIVPCSGGTLGRIASGVSSNLIERAAEVCLKERRKLILVPRETPYSEIMLENMLRAARAGALILPASPGFYASSDTVEQLVDFVVSRILDHLGVPNHLMQRYGDRGFRESPSSDDNPGDYGMTFA